MKKNYTVQILSTTYVDLAEVIENLSNVSNKLPDRFVSEMEARIEGLADMPYMYPVYDDFPVFRKIPLLEHLIIYTVDDAAKLVEVHRIISGHMDVVSRLKEDQHLMP